MTNAEAAVILAREISACDDEWNEAIEKAVKALTLTAEVKIEIIEKHIFAKPDDVSDLDFPGVSREDK